MPSRKEELKLIDKNLGSRSLEPYHCERCGKEIMYQKGATQPQCPNCYATKGILVPMRRYFLVPEIPTRNIGGNDGCYEQNTLPDNQLSTHPA